MSHSTRRKLSIDELPSEIVAALEQQHETVAVTRGDEIVALLEPVREAGIEVLQGLYQNQTAAEATVERILKRRQETHAETAPSLHGRFPQLGAVADEDFEEAKQVWDEGAKRQRKLITDASHE